MNLFEMTAEAKELYALLEADEIDTVTFTDTIEALGANEKLENYVYVQKTLEAEIAAHKAEKERHEARIKSLTANVERLKKAEIAFIQATGATKAKAGTFMLTLRENTVTTILDETKIPTVYMKPQPAKPDKTAIKKAIEAGEVIEGAVLETSYSISAK